MITSSTDEHFLNIKLELLWRMLWWSSHHECIHGHRWTYVHKQKDILSTVKEAYMFYCSFTQKNAIRPACIKSWDSFLDKSILRENLKVKLAIENTQAYQGYCIIPGRDKVRRCEAAVSSEARGVIVKTTPVIFTTSHPSRARVGCRCV